MKKILIVLTFITLSLTVVSAQNGNRFAIKADAGLNLSHGSYNLSKEKLGGRVVAGYHIGAAVDIPILGALYVSPGLKFESRGSNLKLNKLENMSVKDFNDVLKTRMNYAIIPLNVGIRIPFGWNTSVSLETGPYFGWTLSRSQKVSLDGNSSLSDYGQYVQGLAKTEPSKWDMGWGAALYLQFGKIYGKFGADFGFINAFSKSQVEASLKNMSYYLAIGFRL